MPKRACGSFLHSQEGGICNQDGVVMSQKCPILTNYYTDNNAKCVRYFVCNMQERTKDSRCPAKGQR